MFNRDKKNMDKLFEYFDRDIKVFKEKTKLFTYSLNPEFLNVYLFEILSFLNSCQSIQMYYSKYNLMTKTTLEYESLMFISMRAKLALHEVDLDIFHYGNLIKETAYKISGLWIYHVQVFEMIVNELLKTRYKSYTKEELRSEYSIRTSKLCKIHRSTNEILWACFNLIEEAFNFLEVNAKRINELGKSKILKGLDLHSYDFIDLGYLKHSEYTENIDSGFVDPVRKLVDEYFLKRLDLNINDLVLKNKTSKLLEFRMAIQESLDLKYNSRELTKLHALETTKEFKGNTIRGYMNELVFEDKFIDKINYNWTL